MKITFLGHATLEIQINEYSIVVDRFISGNPSASQIKGPTIQEYDQEGVVAPYNIDPIAQAEGWDGLLDPMIAAVHKCQNNSGPYLSLIHI